MPRLIHLNGPPGIGKSTIARRYAAEHPGTLVCDVDVLRTLIGGWREDFAGAGALIRPVAIAMIEAYLAGGHDVIFPQLLVDDDELDRFEACAERAGAVFVERFLMVDADAAVERFARRGVGEAGDPWHDTVREIVATAGGEDLLRDYHAALERLVSSRRGALAIRSVEGDSEATFRLLDASVNGEQPTPHGERAALTQ